MTCLREFIGILNMARKIISYWWLQLILIVKLLYWTLIGIKLVASNGPAPNRSRPKILVVIIFGGPVSIFVPPGEISVRGPGYR